jgi:hypothetical protein
MPARFSICLQICRISCRRRMLEVPGACKDGGVAFYFEDRRAKLDPELGWAASDVTVPATHSHRVKWQIGGTNGRRDGNAHCDRGMPEMR